MSEARVFKSDAEIEVMRWASTIASEAHIEVLKKAKVGMKECQIEAIFVHYGKYNYLLGNVAPYNSVCGCGIGAATLHYIDNDKLLTNGKFMLTDQGHRVHNYISDITTCWPANGKFTQKQKDIYELVLKANREVMKNCKPGVNYRDMHLLAERVQLEGLRDLGLISGDIEEMMEQRLGFIFQPHGLGHLIGLDTHDVGGYLSHCPPRSTKLGLKSMRFARNLEKGMTFTIEPGCYFIDYLLEGKENLGIDLKFLNLDKIREYQTEIDGVRIEDCVVVTDDGVENMSAAIPRTVEEIEKCMAGEEWRS